MTDITDTFYDEKELQALQQANDQKTKARSAQEIKTKKHLRKQSQLEELEGVSHALDKSIHQKEEAITELQKEINKMHREIEKEKKLAAVDEDPTKEEQRLTQQLVQANKKFSTITSEYAQLQQDIESLVIEKENFLQRRSKVEKAIQEANLEIGRVLQKISGRGLIREETESRTVRGLEQARSDKDTYAIKVPELQRQKDHADELAHFLQQNNKPRQPNLNYCSTAEKRGALLKEYETAMEKINDSDVQDVQDRQRGSEIKQRSSEDFANTLMEPSPSTSGKSASKRRSTLMGPMFQGAEAGFGEEFREQQEQLRQLSSTVLQQNFQKPAAGPGPDILYNLYMKGEDLNFSLVNYISEQERRIGQVTRDVQELRKRIEEEQERQSAEHHHLQEGLKQLQLDCQQATQTAERIEKAQEKQESFLGLIKTGVESLASIAGMDISAFNLSSLWTEDSGLGAVFTLLGQIQPMVNQLQDIFSQAQHEEKKDGKRDLKSFSKRPDSRKPDIDVQTSETRPSTSWSMPSVDQVAWPLLRGFLPESEEEYGGEELKPLSRAPEDTVGEVVSLPNIDELL